MFVDKLLTGNQCEADQNSCDAHHESSDRSCGTNIQKRLPTPDRAFDPDESTESTKHDEERRSWQKKRKCGINLVFTSIIVVPEFVRTEDQQ